MDINGINLKAFPSIGAFPNEIGSGVSPGGIGGPWTFNLPLQYYLQGFGKGNRRSKKRSRRFSKRSKKSIRSRKFSKGLRSRRFSKVLKKL